MTPDDLTTLGRLIAEYQRARDVAVAADQTAAWAKDSWEREKAEARKCWDVAGFTLDRINRIIRGE